MKKTRPPSASAPPPGHFWQWLAGIAGLIIVTGCLGFTAWEAWREAKERKPPEVTLAVTSIERLATGYLVKIRAHNAGGSTAANVGVQGELRQDDRTIERSEITFDYLPSQSDRSGGLYFHADPREARLELRASGYEDP